MEALIRAHTALLLKEARRHVRSTGAKVPIEDVAREAELLLLDAQTRGALVAANVVAAASLIRSATRHAAGRVKRRRTLIEQVAAGDDLEAVSRDLASVDCDVPPLSLAPSAEELKNQATLDRLKRGMPPHDALVTALLYEDDFPVDEVATHLTRSPSEIEQARERILFTAKEQGMEGEPDRRALPGQPPDLEVMRELALRKLGGNAAAPPPSTQHVDEALLRLIRDGDASEDIADAITHVAFCADCRASLTEGEVHRRSVVVVAIEATKDATRELERAASEAQAHLFERGAGRWTAIVESSRAGVLRGELEKDDSAMVSRVAMTAPVEVPLQATTQGSVRAPSPSVTEFFVDKGTSAAEVQAWAQVARVKRRRPEAPHAGWTAFAILTVLSAVGIAYMLATR